jgi:hypothetical protein
MLKRASGSCRPEQLLLHRATRRRRQGEEGKPWPTTPFLDVLCHPLLCTACAGPFHIVQPAAVNFNVRYVGEPVMVCAGQQHSSRCRNFIKSTQEEVIAKKNLERSLIYVEI